MRKTLIRTAAAVTVTALSAAFLLSACSRGKGGKAETVSADDPWFDSTVIELGTEEENDPDIDYLSREVMGVFDDQIVVLVRGSRKIPEDIDWMTVDYSEYEINRTEIYDPQGNRGTVIDNDQALRDAGYEGDTYLSIEGIDDDGLKVSFSIWDEDYNYTSYSAHMDLPSGRLSGITETEEDNADDDRSYEGTTVIEGYSLSKYWLTGVGGRDDFYSYIVEIEDPSGRMTSLDFRDLFPDISIFDINSFLGIGNGKVFVPCSGTGEMLYFIIDLNDMSVIQYEDTEWLEGKDFYSANYYEDIGPVISTGNGLSVLNFDDKTVTEFANFGDTYLNVTELTQLQILSVSQDRIILGGTIWEGGFSMNDYSEKCLIVTLDRAQSNPNAGKTVIKAAFTDYVDESGAEAVCIFNRSSEEYFIRYDDRYTTDVFAETIEDYEDLDWTQWELDAEAAMSTQLAMDLLDGNGPDIIFNTMSLSQLNSDDYLMDLSGLIDNEEYFDNIIRMGMTGDKLYQMPLSFIMRGITVPTSELSPGQVGFTFDEYPEFVDRVCNGDDPLHMDKLDAFTNFLTTMDDRFTDGNGRVNYDNDDFRAMAEFVNDHITYIEPDYDDYYYEDVWIEDTESGDSPISVQYTAFYSFGYFIEDYRSHSLDVTLAGIPSVDGRGPSVEVMNSVAVSSSTASPEGCLEFVTSLLSEESQRAYADNSYLPVSRTAFESNASDSIEDYNDYVDSMTEGMTTAEIREWGFDASHLDGSVTERFIEIIGSCSGIVRKDPAVVTIAREEMPAYFEGQKRLDEVIEIMQDRVTTFVNERG